VGPLLPGWGVNVISPSFSGNPSNSTVPSNAARFLPHPANTVRAKRPIANQPAQEFDGAIIALMHRF
jgi:hypothetical protein